MNVKHVGVALCTALFGLAVNHGAVAQQDRRAELMHPESNQGGVVRGLPRASQVSGTHGEHGRNRAAAQKPGATSPSDSTTSGDTNTMTGGTTGSTAGGTPEPCLGC